MKLSRRTAVLFLALFGATSRRSRRSSANVSLIRGSERPWPSRTEPERSSPAPSILSSRMTGDFFLTRYGFSQRPLGTLRGPEGTSPQDLTEIAAAGLLAGLPRTFVATSVDWLDARMLKINGQSWWSFVVDPLLAQLHRGEPPSGCILPSVCMVPRPTQPVPRHGFALWLRPIRLVPRHGSASILPRCANPSRCSWPCRLMCSKLSV